MFLWQKNLVLGSGGSVPSGDGEGQREQKGTVSASGRSGGADVLLIVVFIKCKSEVKSLCVLLGPNFSGGSINIGYDSNNKKEKSSSEKKSLTSFQTLVSHMMLFLALIFTATCSHIHTWELHPYLNNSCFNAEYKVLATSYYLLL